MGRVSSFYDEQPGHVELATKNPEQTVVLREPNIIIAPSLISRCPDFFQL